MARVTSPLFKGFFTIGPVSFLSYGDDQAFLKISRWMIFIPTSHLGSSFNSKGTKRLEFISSVLQHHEGINNDLFDSVFENGYIKSAKYLIKREMEGKKWDKWLEENYFNDYTVIFLPTLKYFLSRVSEEEKGAAVDKLLYISCFNVHADVLEPAFLDPLRYLYVKGAKLIPDFANPEYAELSSITHTPLPMVKLLISWGIVYSGWTKVYPAFFKQVEAKKICDKAQRAFYTKALVREI